MGVQWNRGVKRRECPFWESGCAVSLSLSALCAVTCSWSSGTRTWQRKILACAQHEVFRKHDYYSKVVFKLEQLGRYFSPGIPVPGNWQRAGTHHVDVPWLQACLNPVWFALDPRGSPAPTPVPVFTVKTTTKIPSVQITLYFIILKVSGGNSCSQVAVFCSGMCCSHSGMIIL